MKSLYLLAATLTVLLLLPSPVPADELELMQTIVLKGKAGGLDHVAIDAKRQRLFLANKANNTLDIIDLKAGKLLEQKANQTAIQGVIYAPEVDRVFVGLGTNGLCNAFDGATYKILKTIKFKDDADNVGYNPRTGLVYVAHAENSLGVIDVKTFALKADIKLPAPCEGFVMEVNRPRLYLNIPSPSQLALIDTQKNEVVKSYPVKMAADGHQLALDEANKRVYIGCRKPPTLVIVDTESGMETAGVPIPGIADDVYLDAKRKRLYVGCGEGFLVVFKQTGPDKLEMLEKIPTAKGAKTFVFAPETQTLYLAVPRQPGKQGPEIRVYRAKQ
jgi:DNA-binding beta-propeller fold protein YncE